MTVFRRNAFVDSVASTGLPSDGAITQVLFVDARAPDAVALLDATTAGQAAFLIDAGQNGLKQAAHILASHDLGNLSAVDLIGHGGSEVLSLGAAGLDDASLSDRAADLALIGQSLSSHGDLSLYATAGVGHPGAGLEFVSDLTPAATHAATAAPELSPEVATPAGDHAATALAGHPFETDTQAGGSTPQSVATAGDPDVFILSLAGGVDNALQSVSDTGSYPDNGVTTYFSANSNEPSALNNNVDRLALDPQNNDYFIEVANSGENKILVGSLSGLNTSSTETLTSAYSDSAPNQTGLDGSSEAGFIESIALDPASRNIYFTEGDQFKEVGYGGGAATVLGVATYASGSPNYLIGEALDLTDHTAYFDAKQEVITTARTVHGGTATRGGVSYYTTTFVNALWKAPNILASGQALTKLPLSGLSGAIEDIAIDPSHQYLYITTDVAAGSAAGVYKYALNNNSTGAVTTVYQESGAITGAFGDIVVDAQGKYYVTVENGTNAGDVYVGSTSGGTPTLLYAVPTTLNTGGTDTQPVDVAVDLAPTLTLPAVTSTQPVQGGSAVQILSGAVSAGDPDGAGDLAGATVSLGASYRSGDVLGVTVTGAISGAYNGTTGVLTLSGAGTYAQYEQVLQSVTYRDGATDAGAHPTRTISFSVTDGLVSSTTSNVTLTLDHAPVANPDTNTAVVGGGAATGNVLTNDTDPDNDTLGLASGGNLPGMYGSLTLNLNGTYSYTPNASISAPTGSHPTDSFNYTVTDGHGATATSTLTFILDRAPVVQNVSLTVTAGATGSADAAHGLLSTASDADGDGLTITALDGAGGYVGQQQDGANGDVTVNADGSYSFNAAANPSGPTGSPVTELATFTVSDGHGGLTNAELTVIIDRAPVGVGQTPTVADGTPFGGNALTGATDPDTNATNFSVTQVTPAGGTASAVASNGTTTISGSYGDLVIGANGAYTYTDGATGAKQADLAAVSGSHPIDTFTVTLGDTDGPATGTETLSFTVDRAPVVAAGATVDYAEGSTAAATDSGLTVSDPDGDGIQSATVSIVSGLATGDLLSAPGAAGSGIDAAYDAATGVLSLSEGTTTTAYQSVLDGVTFSATAETVAAHEAAAGADETRTLDYTVNDGALDSLVATSTIDVGIAIADTAAHIASALDALNGDGSITSIQVTDGQPLTITEVQFTGDTTALGLVTDASGLVVADTAANIASGLNALNADPSITSIQVTDGQPLTITAAQFTGDTTALGLVTGADGLIVADTAAAISNAIDALNAGGSVSAIQITDGQPLAITYDQFMDDTTALGLITGAHGVDVSGIPNQRYTTDDLLFDASGRITQETFYDGQNTVLVEWRFTYNPDGSYSRIDDDFSPAKIYGTVTMDYDSNGRLFEAVYSDFTSEPYTTKTLNYGSGGEVTSEIYSGYTTTDYTSLTKDFNSTGALTSAVFSGFANEPYTTETRDYGSNGQLLTETYSGYTTKPYTLLEKIYNSQGDLSSATFSGYTTEPYTTVQDNYNSDGTLKDKVVSGFTGSYASVTETFDGLGRHSTYAYYDASNELLKDVSIAYHNDGSYSSTASNVTGKFYTGYLEDYSAAGALISEAIYKKGGAEHDIAYASGVTFATDGSPQTINLVDGDTVMIHAGYGQAKIYGYDGASGGNETFDVDSSVFSSFNDLLAHAHAASNGDAVVKDTAGVEIEFVNVTLNQLSHHSSDFIFT